MFIIFAWNCTFQGIEKTKNGHFGGGNTAWEEKNLLIYAKSELRFVEIHDSLCTETTQNQDMVRYNIHMIMN